MARNFQELQARLKAKPGVAAINAAADRADRVGATLIELRKGREVPPFPPDVDGEGDAPRDDVFLKLVDAYVRALGGRLDLRVVFDDGTYTVCPDGTVEKLP